MSTPAKYIFSKKELSFENIFNSEYRTPVFGPHTSFEDASEYCKKLNLLEKYDFCYISLDKNFFVYRLEFIKDNEQVFDYTIQETVGFTHVGFLLEIDAMTFRLMVYTKAEIEKYRPAMIVYDGKMLDRELVPAHLKYLISEKANMPQNPVPATAHMYSDKGTMVVSSCNVMGLPQHIFFPMPETLDDIHFKEQWLSSSYDLKQEQFVGYSFKSDTYLLTSVKMITRIGTHEKPGIQAPAPKICIIEGRIPDTDQWESITEEIEFDRSMWSFLAPIELDLSEAETKFYQGFRVRITEWFPGARVDMLTGLMRLEFMCTVPHAIKTPTYVTPDINNLVYAQFNSLLLDTAPKPTYIEKVVEKKEEIVKFDSAIKNTTIVPIDENNYTSIIDTTSSYISNSEIPFISLTSKEPIEINNTSSVFYRNHTVAYVNMTDDNILFKTESPSKFVLLQYEKQYTTKLSISSGDILIVRKESDDLFVVCVDNSPR